ncbi:MAG TPA: hypothetical protein P5550_09420 [Bacteroidales bacterium]|nr:hypothetical protein [Bacteroidales bacterium]
MNMKVIYAALAGAVAYFLLGWLVWGTLLMDFMEANSTHYPGLMKEEPMLGLYFLSNLAISFMLAYVFHQWAGFRTAARGAWGGLLIGACIVISYDLMFFGGMNMFNSKAMAVDIIAGTLVLGIVGAVIGWVLGLGKKPA